MCCVVTADNIPSFAFEMVSPEYINSKEDLTAVVSGMEAYSRGGRSSNR
jgi:hypothetical protein